eukprot:TRINITY_DN9254_c0_g1_i2.p1 TRINITY_DN9254_c0_g1~~TRINITY_DN9254_c0_g1_i2.p1  ORF type:complete len:262 (+),score=71.27 TRINITY_DN9254_c0_g1_i2:57-842(+)
MIRRPPRSTLSSSSAASDVYKRQVLTPSGAVTGAAMLSEGHPLLLAVPSPAPAVEAVEAHFSQHPLPKGINGPEASTELFASLRATRGDQPWVRGLHLVLYELAGPEALVCEDLAPGEAIRVLTDSVEDLALVNVLVGGFAAELDLPGAAELAAQRLASRGTAANFLVLEHHDGVKALVSSARETETCGVINTVFTPVEWRKQGCAARAVSAACVRLFERKSTVALFADADAAGPNRLYQKLGFKEAGQSQSWGPHEAGGL